jgi:hypothetical protein
MMRKDIDKSGLKSVINGATKEIFAVISWEKHFKTPPFKAVKESHKYEL